MTIYVVKFSNGLYLRNPFFSFDEGLEMGFTSDINKAKIIDSFESADRMAKNELAKCNEMPEFFKEVSGCTYSIVQVEIKEVII